MNIAINNTTTPDLDRLGWLQKRAPQRYVGLEGLEDALRERSSKASTVTLQNREVNLIPNPNPRTMDEANQLVVHVGDGNVTGLTHWSFGQLSQLAGAPAAFMRRLPASLVADNIHYCMQYLREVEEVKAYYDGQKLRAVTGPNYGRIDDYEIVEAIQTVIDTGRFVPAEDHMGLSVTEQSLNCFLIDKDNPIVVGKTPRGDDDVMFRGFRMLNSEVGAKSLGLSAFLFRSYCTNGCIFGMKDSGTINIRHTSGAPYRWAREVQPAIEAFANDDGSTLVNHVTRAKERIVAEDNDRALEWLQKRGLTKSQSTTVIERVQIEENRNPRSLWDMTQGITAMARSVDDVDSRAELEELGGRVFAMAA